MASDGGYYGEEDDMFEAKHLMSISKTHDPNCYIEKYEYESNYEKTVRLEFERDALQNLVNEYEQLEQDGLLVRLPCKVNDTVYVIPSKVNFDLNVVNRYSENNRVYKQIVEQIKFFKNNVYLLSTCGGLQACHSKFYKIDWFLTESDAIKALEGLKND